MNREELQARLEIPLDGLHAANRALLNPNSRAITDLLDVVLKYGSPGEINAKARRAAELPVLLERVRQMRPDYLVQLEWLDEQRWRNSFISVGDYRRKVLGDAAGQMQFKDRAPVTLEISSCQYFPWFIEMARRAIRDEMIMPGRFVHVRSMQEQAADGDLPAFAAAMHIIGASYVEQLDTRGSDGANIHLGGPDTLAGYFGGVGMPNDYPLKWLDEYLYYYTEYGVRQVLNVNSGTVFLAYLLHRLGIDIEFKISVTLGTDNPYSLLWTLLTARLLARPDGSPPLVGVNWSSSTNNETIEVAASLRNELGFEDLVRFEQLITQAWKGLVIQPYNRREDLLALAECVSNLSAKHEGGEPEVEAARARPSDINDYYRSKDEIMASGDFEALTLNFFDKFDSLNLTARALTQRGLAFLAARRLHHHR
jgi:hypothetical protein